MVGQEQVIVLGDLNARHVQFQDHTSKDYVKMQDGWERKESTDGRWTFTKGTARSVVDHIFASQHACVRKVTVHETNGVEGTDHAEIPCAVLSRATQHKNHKDSAQVGGYQMKKPARNMLPLRQDLSKDHQQIANAMMTSIDRFTRCNQPEATQPDP